MTDNIYYDFWYLKSEEINLDGSDTGAAAYEVGINVFADEEFNQLLDDVRISGLDKEELLSFDVLNADRLFSKLEEEGLHSVVHDIKTAGFYFVMGEKISVSQGK
ncbi:hypothetical protein M4D55_18775 [Metabacillus idriensis]|uniref:Uncharacterized protein n=1 Tax=Metabacillus idriensis TaxID=324768 RepID=A0A6I2MKE4_9BACI|nr:hypothetical protein [Metabacillus idriensis]MCM3597817.1 hypothetical protein [Metabacillus idriensis]MRX56303.1 hypothetical protein [Metabacillus idriensis]OHR70449.1 hypothetical protein HMPREF3291_06995 [Bacillus sp. HMSC76G11]